MENNYLNEEWRPVRGYEGQYEVSNYGRMRSLNYYGRGVCKIMRLTAGWNRYIKVGLRGRDGEMKYFRVHRLVAEAFLPAPLPEQTQVNHIDGNKQNNMVVEGRCNLEWVTPRDNCNNPNTKANYYVRYHRAGEFERRSAGQKKRFAERPEDVKKLRDGYRRYWEARRAGQYARA